MLRAVEVDTLFCLTFMTRDKAGLIITNIIIALSQLTLHSCPNKSIQGWSCIKAGPRLEAGVKTWLKEIERPGPLFEELCYLCFQQHVCP